jgi:hypothetical protein
MVKRFIILSLQDDGIDKEVICVVSPSQEKVVFGDKITLCNNVDNGPLGASHFGLFEEI